MAERDPVPNTNNRRNPGLVFLKILKMTHAGPSTTVLERPHFRSLCLGRHPFPSSQPALPQIGGSDGEGGQEAGASWERTEL